MKKYKKNTKYLIAVFLAFFVLISCNDDFLDEEPRSFLSPDLAFSNQEGFETSIANLHRLARAIRTNDTHVQDGRARTTLYGYGTDIGWYWDKKNFLGDYSILNSSIPEMLNWWRRFYDIIKDANVIISRSEEPDPLWDSDDDRLIIQAKARFFRAFAYRYLVNLYGDVPLITLELTAPKFDYVRAPKSDIFDLIISDLEFASEKLPVNNPDNGRLSKAAADHVLSEIYITIGNFDKAIEAASRVINDGQYQLMTQRFGSLMDKPGDVFWDLFRLGNQNRSSGNTETIWAWQVEYDVLGGETLYQIERYWGPLAERLKDPDGVAALLKDDALGRPVGFVRPSPYLEYTIWATDWNNDIRNSPYNMKREYIINNPASAYFGQVVVPSASDTARYHYMWIQKAAHPHGHPQGYDTGGRIWSDIYAIRLAETYLLRAEAYLRKGDLPNAAADINVVRSRANAIPVLPGEVDIHYILDERARELTVEEPRMLTLHRLNLLDERVTMYNPVSAPTIQEFHNLWPIPQSIIDANTKLVMEQNPGY